MARPFCRSRSSRALVASMCEEHCLHWTHWLSLPFTPFRPQYRGANCCNERLVSFYHSPLREGCKTSPVPGRRASRGPLWCHEFWMTRKLGNRWFEEFVLHQVWRYTESIGKANLELPKFLLQTHSSSSNNWRKQPHCRRVEQGVTGLL